jgi:hypothetical protein
MIFVFLCVSCLYIVFFIVRHVLCFIGWFVKGPIFFLCWLYMFGLEGILYLCVCVLCSNIVLKSAIGSQLSQSDDDSGVTEAGKNTSGGFSLIMTRRVFLLDDGKVSGDVNMLFRPSSFKGRFIIC